VTLRQLWTRLHTLRYRRCKETELDEEIRFHPSEETEEHVASGLSLEQARAEAHKDFGNITKVQKATCEAWGLSRMEIAVTNLLKTSFRNIVRSPRLSLAAVLCIGLAMTATSAAATLVAATLLRSLPFPDAERLVRVWLEQLRKLSRGMCFTLALSRIVPRDRNDYLSIPGAPL